MKATQINIQAYYVSVKERWVPFEVMRMRYEEAFTSLTEEEVCHYRTYKARWFYQEKTEKNQVAAHKRESDAGVHENYICLLEEQTKRLVLKKPKEEKKKLSEIEKMQRLREANVGVKNIHHVYFSMGEKKGNNYFAYLLLDGKGNILQKEAVEAVRTTRNNEPTILKAILYLLKKAKELKIQQIVLHTHHVDYHETLTKIGQQQNNKKVRHFKKVYPEFLSLWNEFERVQYKLIKKEKNKEAVETLHTMRPPITKTHHAYVDISIDYEQKRSYIGGLLKNRSGETTLSYTKPITYSKNTTKLEIFAIIAMMKQAYENNYTPVIIHTDNKAAYDYFSQNIKTSRKNQHTYKTIAKAKKNYPHCSVQLISRDQNKEAHHLARNYKKAL